MRDLLKRAWRGEAGLYVRCLLVVGSVALAFLAWASVLGCDEYDQPTHPGCGTTSSSAANDMLPGPPLSIQTNIAGVTDFAAPDQPMDRYLSCSGMATATTARYTYYPPPDAHSFSFPDRQPRAGGPPFIFDNLPVDAVVSLHICMPGLSSVTAGNYEAAESLLVETSDGQQSSAAHNTRIDTAIITGSPPVATENQSTAPPATTQPQAARADVSQIWEVVRWLDFPKEAMNASRCLEWFNFLRSDKAFFAIRVPVPAAPAGKAAHLPLESACSTLLGSGWAGGG